MTATAEEKGIIGMLIFCWPLSLLYSLFVGGPCMWTMMLTMTTMTMVMDMEPSSFHVGWQMRPTMSPPSALDRHCRFYRAFDADFKDFFIIENINHRYQQEEDGRDPFDFYFGPRCG